MLIKTLQHREHEIPLCPDTVCLLVLRRMMFLKRPLSTSELMVVSCDGIKNLNNILLLIILLKTITISGFKNIKFNNLKLIVLYNHVLFGKFYLYDLNLEQKVKCLLVNIFNYHAKAHFSILIIQLLKG